MVKIPQVIAQRGLDSSASTMPRYSGGGEIGRALSSVGDSVSAVAARYQAQQDQQDGFNATNAWSEMNSNLQTEYMEAANNYDPSTGENLVSTFMPRVQEAYESFRQGLSPKQQQRYDVKFGTAYTADWENRMARTQLSRTVDWQKGQVTNEVARVGMAAFNDPSYFEIGLATINDKLDNSSINRVDREQLRSRFTLLIANETRKGLLAQADALTEQGRFEEREEVYRSLESLDDRVRKFAPPSSGRIPGGNAPGGVVVPGPSGAAGNYRESISAIESGSRAGNYSALGPVTRSGDRAYGRYQIMGNNIGPWSQAALGRRVSTQEFLKNPEIQDQIFDHVFQGYVAKYGPGGAARAWFAGEGGMNNLNATDATATSRGTKVSDYERRFLAGLGQGSRAQPTQVASLEAGGTPKIMDDGSPAAQQTAQVPPQVMGISKDPSEYTSWDAFRDQTRNMINLSREKGATKAKAIIEQRERNVLSEYALTGSAAIPLTRDDFERTYGPERAQPEFDRHMNDVRTTLVTRNMLTLSPRERADTVRVFEPQPGDMDFAAKTQTYAKVIKAAQDADTLMRKDPGAFIHQSSPTVRRFFMDLQTSLTGDQPPEEKQRIASAYMMAADQEFARQGVSPAQRRYLPSDTASAITEQMNAIVRKQADPRAVVGEINALASTFGPHWNTIYRELASKEGGKNLGSLLHVLGSGPRPGAAALLVEVKDLSPDKILSAQSNVKLNDLKKEVNAAFDPMRRSLAGNLYDQITVGHFVEEAQKLAAVNVMRGADAKSAAQQAFTELVGYKYDVVDGKNAVIRLPKAAGLESRELTQALNVLRGSASSRVGGEVMFEIGKGNYDIELPPHSLGEKSNAFVHDQVVAELKRAGVFVTTPREDGVELHYNGQLQRKADGSPFRLTWEELAGIQREWLGGFKRLQEPQRAPLGAAGRRPGAGP